MGQINLLEQETIDKIAAGEVIERPASIVKELVENAIDAGSNAITVEIKEGGISFIRITDNGVGIPAKDTELIFTRFYRVDKTRSRETGGTGLGLAIVKQVVKLHRGEVTVKSEEGKGSTFTVELPALRRAVPSWCAIFSLIPRLGKNF